MVQIEERQGRGESSDRGGADLFKGNEHGGPDDVAENPEPNRAGGIRQTRATPSAKCSFTG
jgi:hypothetical protein